MSTSAVSVAIAGFVELAKLGLQVYFSSVRQAGLTDEQAEELLQSERDRFNENVSKPLPEV
jgi:hypothetical protein